MLFSHLYDSLLPYKEQILSKWKKAPLAHTLFKLRIFKHN